MTRKGSKRRLWLSSRKLSLKGRSARLRKNIHLNNDYQDRHSQPSNRLSGGDSENQSKMTNPKFFDVPTIENGLAMENYSDVDFVDVFLNGLMHLNSVCSDPSPSQTSLNSSDFDSDKTYQTLCSKVNGSIYIPCNDIPHNIMDSSAESIRNVGIETNISYTIETQGNLVSVGEGPKTDNSYITIPNISSSHNISENVHNDCINFFDAKKSCIYEQGNRIEINAKHKKSMKGHEEIELEGRRIVDIQHFIDSLKLIADHASHMGCTLNNLKVVGECRKGFCSEIKFKCNMCSEIRTITTVYDHDDINNSAVMGVTTMGSGFTHLNHFSSSIDIPMLSPSTYSRIQEKMSDLWEEIAVEEMLRATEEEKKLAIECGDVTPEGIPFITVVCDGVWAKRSYRSNYSSLSGAAAIVGYKTRKILYLAVRNKFCIICKKHSTEAIDHKCYRNWSGSSSAMESDIIAEGFMRSLNMYGLIYKQMVADGDSSCYKKKLDCNPYREQNIRVEKLECRNHLLRNYMNEIRDLSKDTSAGPLVLRKAIKKNEIRFRYGVTKAIQYRKSEENTILEMRTENLRRDILNSPSHILGDHKSCSAYFCSKDGDYNILADMKLTPLYDKLMIAVRYLANHASSLIHDVDNNCVEQFNNVIAKHSGGKRINYIMERSYQTRCFASVVSLNSRRQFSVLQEKYGKNNVGKYTKNFEERKTRKLNQSASYRIKRKKEYHQSSEKNNEAFYGESCNKPDLDDVSLESAKVEFLKCLSLSAEEKNQIELLTRSQSQCELWFSERRKRVTASKFGEICKKRPSSSVKNLVKSIVFPKQIYAKSLEHGLKNKERALKELESYLGMEIDKCGLFIHKTINFIAATPDGIIKNSKTIVEIKCPFSAKDLTPDDGIAARKITFWTKNGSINTNHNWYYQIQGQLQICDYALCYLCVWTEKGIKVEKVHRNDIFWKERMEGPIKKMYFENVLPELVDSRIDRQLQIRDRI